MKESHQINGMKKREKDDAMKMEMSETTSRQ